MARPSSRMTLGWSSRRSTVISLAMNRTLSGSTASNRTFFSATTRPVSTSRALYTLLYVPDPIWNPAPTPRSKLSSTQRAKGSIFTTGRGGGTVPWRASGSSQLGGASIHGWRRQRLRRARRASRRRRKVGQRGCGGGRGAAEGALSRRRRRGPGACWRRSPWVTTYMEDDGK